MSYTVINTDTYPKNGKHQTCLTGLPFDIQKGEGGYYYKVKGVQKKYNLGKKVDERWICHLEDYANHSLQRIFEIKVNKDLDEIVKYCVKLYLKSLQMEREKVISEFAEFISKNK